MSKKYTADILEVVTITDGTYSFSLPASSGTFALTSDLASIHSHTNKATLDKFGEDGSGNPTYNGIEIDTTIAQRDVYDGLDSNDNTISLSAKQGKILKDVQDTQETAVGLNTAKISFDSTASTKLSGIEAGAEVNVQSDWNATTGDAFIKNKPSLFDGAYSSLSGLPTLFDGAYGSLTGTPTIPSGNAIIDWTTNQGSTNIHSGNYVNTTYTNVSEFTNDAGYTANIGTTTASNTQTFTNKSGNISQWTNNSGYLTSANAALTYEPLKGSDDNYVTDAQLVVIGNTSGTNTGDQDLSGYALTSAIPSGNSIIDWTTDQGATNIHANNITGYLKDTTDTFTGTLTVTGVKNTAIIQLGSTTTNTSWVVGDKIGAIEFGSADISGAGAGVKASISYELEAGTTGSTNSMVFRSAGTSAGTNNTERMRIKSDGNIQFNSYGAGLLQTDASGNVSVDSSTYLTSTNLDGYLLNTTGTFTGTLTMSSGAVPFIFKESGYTGEGKYWRHVQDGGGLRFDSCTTGDGVFTPYVAALQLGKDGAVKFGGLATAGFMKTDAAGNVSIDTDAYALTSAIPSGNAIIDWTADQGATNIHANNITGYQVSGNYFTDGDTTLNMANNDGLVYDDTTNKMYVKLDGTNREILHTGNTTIPSGNSIIDWTTDQGSTNIHANNITGYLPLAGGTMTGRLIIDTDVSGDGGWDNAGILLRNDGDPAGEVAIAFDNLSTGTNYWIQGLNQTEIMKWAYGSSFTDANQKMQLTSGGNLTTVGTMSASNLSGTNTGDQDLSGYLLNTTDTFTGNLTIEGASTPTLNLKDTTNDLDLRFRAANNFAYIEVDSANEVATSKLVFRIDGNEALNLDNGLDATFAGDVAISGSTSLGTTYNGYRLNVGVDDLANYSIFATGRIFSGTDIFASEEIQGETGIFETIKIISQGAGSDIVFDNTSDSSTLNEILPNTAGAATLSIGSNSGSDSFLSVNTYYETGINFYNISKTDHTSIDASTSISGNGIDTDGNVMADGYIIASLNRLQIVEDADLSNDGDYYVNLSNGKNVVKIDTSIGFGEVPQLRIGSGNTSSRVTVVNVGSDDIEITIVSGSGVDLTVAGAGPFLYSGYTSELIKISDDEWVATNLLS